VTDPDILLRDLGAHLDVPPPPEEPALAAAVLARLDDPPRRTLLPRLAAAAAALLAALGLAMAVSPEVRAAVLDFLNLGAIQINQAPEQAGQPSVEPSLDKPLPGERAVTLDQARAQAGFPLRVPESLGDPLAVHLADGDPPRIATLLYNGVRVDQIDGDLAPMFQKFFHLDGAVPTTIDGSHGLWLPSPHPVFYLDRDGDTQERFARLSGSTLIWEQDGVTYRVEGELTHRQAVDIAVDIAESLPE
jgi:hypothetical protein